MDNPMPTRVAMVVFRGTTAGITIITSGITTVATADATTTHITITITNPTTNPSTTTRAHSPKKQTHVSITTRVSHPTFGRQASHNQAHVPIRTHVSHPTVLTHVLAATKAQVPIRTHVSHPTRAFRYPTIITTTTHNITTHVTTTIAAQNHWL